jgi:predicted homoserine dehydrogenase-like protein
VIETVTCLRDPYEAGLGGGVFIVVGCENDYSRHILITKGLIPNSKGTTAVIYRPYHLCGVETPLSILVAGLLQLPTGATEYRPAFDVIVQTTKNLSAGEPIGSDHSPSLQALVRPAQPITADTPVPLHMANSNRLKVDVPRGTVLTVEMIEPPADSVLWSLRAEQDRHFLTDHH